ncbi:zf-HC2 domain-containing protein [Streptomyces sp. NPDC047072]|uniref:anti-sigma factor family protein n=1 Tax=Streptomyces sp. NPDC047072 TaxID=3154809 RepID=UPI0034001AC4
MSIAQHDSALLGAYVLGALDEQEVRDVDDHVASCERCRDELDGLREMENALGEVPPEAFIDGPPQDGDLILQRTLRQVRAEGNRSDLRRRVALSAVAAVAAAAVLGAGVLLGQNTGGTNDQVLPPTSSTAVTPPPAGQRVATASAATGVRGTVKLTPASQWVRVNAAVAGIPAGEHCRLIVETANGKREVAGSWVVADQLKGSHLDGSAAVPAADVSRVLVENEQGKQYLSVAF